jgi:hypothetical protein
MKRFSPARRKVKVEAKAEIEQRTMEVGGLRRNAITSTLVPLPSNFLPSTSA